MPMTRREAVLHGYVGTVHRKDVGAPDWVRAAVVTDYAVERAIGALDVLHDAVEVVLTAEQTQRLLDAADAVVARSAACPERHSDLPVNRLYSRIQDRMEALED